MKRNQGLEIFSSSQLNLCVINYFSILVIIINYVYFLYCRLLLKKMVLEKTGSCIRISPAADLLIWRVEVVYYGLMLGT